MRPRLVDENHASQLPPAVGDPDLREPHTSAPTSSSTSANWKDPPRPQEATLIRLEFGNQWVQQRCWNDQSSHGPPTEYRHSNDPREFRVNRLVLTPRTGASSTVPLQLNTTEENPERNMARQKEEHTTITTKWSTTKAARTERTELERLSEKSKAKVIDGPASEQKPAATHGPSQRQQVPHSNGYHHARAPEKHSGPNLTEERTKKPDAKPPDLERGGVDLETGKPPHSSTKPKTPTPHQALPSRPRRDSNLRLALPERLHQRLPDPLNIIGVMATKHIGEVERAKEKQGEEKTEAEEPPTAGSRKRKGRG
ncbi:hypothetical protein DY000_02022794 [Brassica cretica]|uniref:Uncharacterized protein n=1 Tax=Brassica cretica TaxID=69181 RepID=A0ABQ7E6H0_BRACR|nr:hypothetical protein DY000_02022794 [Brassica cretica]